MAGEEEEQAEAEESGVGRLREELSILVSSQVERLAEKASDKNSRRDECADRCRLDMCLKGYPWVRWKLSTDF